MVKFTFMSKVVQLNQMLFQQQQLFLKILVMDVNVLHMLLLTLLREIWFLIKIMLLWLLMKMDVVFPYGIPNF
jgi:hypothetical protein